MNEKRRTGVILTVLAGLCLMLAAAGPAFAKGPRIIDEKDRVSLSGNVHPHAKPEFEMGPSDPALPMEEMVLALRTPPDKQAALEKYLAELQDAASPNYQRWLSPEEYADRFGATPEDVAAVTEWLASQGFKVEQVAKGRNWINFSGKASHVEKAFRARMRDYFIEGRVHHANADNPSIPRGLSDLVTGIVSLNNFPRKPMNTGRRPLDPTELQPNFTSGSSHYLSPADFAIIYNLNPLYNAGIDGAGQSVAIVGRSNPGTANWTTFRSKMALPANDPEVIINGADPGPLGGGEDTEADLDVEWAGAVAKNAKIRFVTSKSTNTTDGFDLSAQYIVNNNLAPVMSVSFGLCESLMGSAGNAFYNNLWAQAAAQGITVFVSSGDSGIAGCNPASASTGSGPGVNGLSSTPYNVSVGGTQFDEGVGTYWSSTNGTGYRSALGYIPEKAWNESGNVTGGSGLWSTGGGVSTLYSRPSWQAAPGVPAENRRNTPDVSLTAATHDGYLVQTQGALYVIGGTSASSPAFAGLMALVNQKTGKRQGNANARFYEMARAQYGAGGPAVYHDTTKGDNSVPGVTGNYCGAGYDLATGLGSVNATALVNNWEVAAIPGFTISAAPTAISADQGKAGTVSLNTTVSGGFNSAVTFTVSGLPTGATASFAPASIAAPGAGSSTLTITTSTSTPVGSYAVSVAANGGGVTSTANLTLTVTAANSTPTTLFSHGFEGSGWSAAQVYGTGGRWSLATSGRYPAAAPHGGSYLASFNSRTAVSGSKTRIYRSVGLTIPSIYSSATLKFWMYHDTGYPNNRDTVQPQLSTNRSTWVNAGAALPRYNGSTGWTQVSIDVSAYRGKTVYLGFVGASGKGNDIYLDDVQVTAK